MQIIRFLVFLALIGFVLAKFSPSLFQRIFHPDQTNSFISPTHHSLSQLKLDFTHFNFQTLDKAFNASFQKLPTNNLRQRKDQIINQFVQQSTQKIKQIPTHEADQLKQQFCQDLIKQAIEQVQKECQLNEN